MKKHSKVFIDIFWLSNIGVSSGILSAYTSNAIIKNQFNFVNLCIMIGFTLVFTFIVAWLTQTIYRSITKKKSKV